MIKSLLLEIQQSIEESILRLGFKTNPGIAQYILDSIETDLTQLKRQDPHFADSAQGYIDYYSPYAEDQIKNKQLLLEKYLEQLTIMEAVIICVNQKLNEGKELAKNKENVSQKAVSDKKNEIQALLKIKDPTELLMRKDVSTEITRIKEVNTARYELKEIEQELKMIERILSGEDATKKELDDETREELEDDKRMRIENRVALIDKIQSIDENVKGYKPIANQHNRIKGKLDKHIKIATEIPEGMLDVKRALSFQGELKVIQNKIQIEQHMLSSLTDPEKIQSSKDRLAGLEKKEQTLLSIKFSATDEEDKEIKERLEELRGLMSSSIKGYQEIAVAGGDLNAFLHKTTGFYWENLYVYRKTLAAFNKYIENGLDLTPEGQLVQKCIENALNETPSNLVILNALVRVSKVDKNLNKREDKYDEYVQDILEWDSDDDESDDDDDSEDKIPVRFYKRAAVSIAEAILNEQSAPLFFIPYNSRSYVLDHPAGSDLADTLGNCYGETQMFLYRINGKNPKFNNICPQTELLNLQLDQSRSMAATESQVIGTFEANKEAGEFVNWNTMKDMLTQEVDSQKNGDVCWLKLMGARVPGHAKNVNHAIGFIKLSNPSPYKYVVYDYSLGAMGFSTDEQLGLYFKKMLEGEEALYPYSKCVLNKIAEVSDECQSFFNGPNGVKPIEKADPNISCERSYWNKQRLMLLLKYNSKIEDVPFVLSRMESLNLDEKSEIYQAILSNKKIDFNSVLKIAVKRENLELLNFILRHNYYKEGLASFHSNRLLSPPVTRHILHSIMSGETTAEQAYKAFDIRLTKQVVMLICLNEIDSEVPFKMFGTKLEDAALQLMVNREFDTGIMCKLFNNSKNILILGIRRNPDNITHASDVLLNDKEFISAAVKVKPALLKHASDYLKNDKEYITELATLYPETIAYSNLSNNKEYILELIKTTPVVLTHLPDLKTDRAFSLEAIKMNAQAICFTDCSSERSFLLEGVKENPDVLNWVDAQFKNTTLYTKLMEHHQNQNLSLFVSELLNKKTENKYHTLIKNPNHVDKNRFHLFNARYKEFSSDIGKQAILEEFKESLQTYKNVDDAFENIEDLKEKVEFLSTGQGLLTRVFHWETDSITALKDMISQYGENPDKLLDIVDKSCAKGFKK